MISTVLDLFDCSQKNICFAFCQKLVVFLYDFWPQVVASPEHYGAQVSATFAARRRNTVAAARLEPETLAK